MARSLLFPAEEDIAMEPVVGIFATRAAAEKAAREVLVQGFPASRLEQLLPGMLPDTPELPTEDAEQPGVGQAVGGVVGAATGASAGFGLGAVTASLLLPGIGAVSAVGMAAAALLGVLGGVGGAMAGEAVEEKSREGLPRDEAYLYEDALSEGKGVVLAFVRSEQEADALRRIFTSAGAESLDAARQKWWVGIRDGETGTAHGAAALPHTVYRRGFLAALEPDLEGRSHAEALETLRKRVGDVALSEAFQRGYRRGAEVAADRAKALGAGHRP
jgi:hypothetical protein